MSYEPDFPFIADPLAVLATFVGALLLFHLLFVLWRPLTSRDLKMIDYWWLGAAIFGLVGSTYGVRRLIAERRLHEFKERSDSRYEVFYHSVDRMARPKVSERSEFSPPDFDDIVREYDSARAFAAKLLKRLPRPGDTGNRAGPWPPRPHIRASNKPLLEDFAYLDSDYQEYLAAEHGFATMRAAAERTDADVMITALSPLLLALALALRVTKVTGELLLERRARGIL